MDILRKIDIKGGNTTKIITTTHRTFLDNNKITHSTNNICIGDDSKQYIKDKIVNWTSFKKIYYTNNILDPKHYSRLLTLISEIIPISNQITDENQILNNISHMYNLQCESIIDILADDYDIQSSFKKSIQHLFMSYKCALEYIIELFVLLRNKYIMSNKTVKSKIIHMSNLYSKWNAICNINNINTTSPLLYFSFNQHNQSKITKTSGLTKKKGDKTIPYILWDVPIDSVSTHIDKFISDLKSTKFQYPGFCPHVALDRMNYILKFPYINLIIAIKELVKQTKSKQYIPILNKLSTLFETIKNIIPKDQSYLIKNINCSKDASVLNIKINKQFSSKDTVPYRIKIFEQYLDAFTTLYIKLADFLIIKENHIVKISIKLSKLSNDINNLIKPIT